MKEKVDSIIEILKTAIPMPFVRSIMRRTTS